jgi:hypothetical protein
MACPNLLYPIKHGIKECVGMKNFMTSGALTKGREPEGPSAKKGMTPFLREDATMTI